MVELKTKDRLEGAVLCVIIVLGLYIGVWLTGGLF